MGRGLISRKARRLPHRRAFVFQRARFIGHTTGGELRGDGGESGRGRYDTDPAKCQPTSGGGSFSLRR